MNRNEVAKIEWGCLKSKYNVYRHPELVSGSAHNQQDVLLSKTS